MDQNETQPGNSTRNLAIIAIVIALTAPFWEGAVLGSINIPMPMATKVADTARALSGLDRRTAALEQQLGSATTQIAKLQAQLDQTAARANTAADRTALLTMAELAGALRRQGGFELELAAMRAVVAEPGEMRPLLDQIEPYAVTGVPSTLRLRQEFARISSRIAWSQRGFLSIGWVMHMLPWQHGASAAAPAATDNTPQLLSEASTELGSGDLAAAVATVQSIHAGAQDLFADWLEDARARVAADAVTQRLTDQIARWPDRPAPPPRKA